MSLYDNDDGARGEQLDFEERNVALILAEGILHVLVEKGLLKTEDAISALQTAAEVMISVASRDTDPSAQTRAAIDALFQMMDSFAVDLDPEAQTQARLSWEQRIRRG